MLVPIVEEKDRVGRELEEKYNIIYFKYDPGLPTEMVNQQPNVNPKQPQFPKFHGTYIGNLEANDEFKP